MNRKTADILFKVGIGVIIAGAVSGALLGVLLSSGGFNLVPSVTVWLLSLITGTGVITVSSSLSEAGEKKRADELALEDIIERIKSEDSDKTEPKNE